jgi:hypothetical protein
MPRSFVREASPEDIVGFFAKTEMTILTLLGYSDTGYEDKAAMLNHVALLLDQMETSSTIVNIGATLSGIGAAYELAKQKGFITSGIVSTCARECRAPLSPYVDMTFFVSDDVWGGYVGATKQLSSTSEAMVAASSELVAIGGGPIARDEFIAAARLGKPTHFIPADMDHARAEKMALQNGLPKPTDFRGQLAISLSKL